jgi:hypothetical protein
VRQAAIICEVTDQTVYDWINDAARLGRPIAEKGVGLGNTENGSGLDDVSDDYDRLLASISRSYDDDVRVAVHESGHIVAARLLGHAVGGATVTLGPGFDCRVWGERHMRAFSEGRGDASDIREALAPVMPKAGEDRPAVADVFGNVYAHCIELMAGRTAEAMLLQGEQSPPADDLRQARELSMLVCSSEEAIESFIAHCEVAARDLLQPHGDSVIALSTVLRIKRTLDGTAIDRLISELQARKALAIECLRRADWRKRGLSDDRFAAY